MFRFQREKPSWQLTYLPTSQPSREYRAVAQPSQQLEGAFASTRDTILPCLCAAL
jgi:hypothetical protein